MSKKIIISIFVLISLINTSLAQEGSEESEDREKKNDFISKFFLATYTSTFSDFILSPLNYYYEPTGLTDPSGNPIFADIPYQTKQFNIFSFGIELRYNFKEFDENTSLSISTPISIGISNSIPAAGDDELVVRGVPGFGSIQVPLLIKINTGNGSTYTTQKDYGFSAGAGFELNKIGLISSESTANNYNKAFVYPCVSGGFTFMRGNSPMEINLKFAFGSPQDQNTDARGRELKDKYDIPYVRNTRGHTIKLSFVYLMNY